MHRLLPHRLRQHTSYLLLFDASYQALGLKRSSLFGINQNIRVQDTNGPVGNVVEVHRSHMSSSSTYRSCLGGIFIGRSQKALNAILRSLGVAACFRRYSTSAS